MNSEGSLLNWVLGTLLSAVSVLCGVITKLYYSQLSDHKSTKTALEERVVLLEEKVDHCETEHSEARVLIGRLETRLSLVEKQATL